VRTCEKCHCFENCIKLNSFCREMVFRLRRIDITLVDNLAECCEHHISADDVKKAQEKELYPMLFVINS
jgi:hypothetical protein